MGAADSRDNPLWSYMLQRYGRPGVREGCLALQDGAGVDVAFVFACVWLSQRGTQVETARAALVEALDSVGTVRGEVLRPVRAARRALKRLGSVEEVGEVREQIKRAELGVESLCIARIHRALSVAPAGQGAADPRALFGVYLDLETLQLDAAGERAFAELVERLTRSEA